MTEKYSEVIKVEDEVGPVNRRQADNYVDTLDKIISNFHQLLNEDKKDALHITIWSLKRHNGNMFEKMKTIDIKTVVACIKDPYCTYLRETLQTESVQSIDHDEDLPSGEEILQRLSASRHYTREVKKHIITCFNHLAVVMSEASLVAANISVLGRIADEETFDIVLRAAVHPLIQKNMPGFSTNDKYQNWGYGTCL